ncbi:MAG TPA: type II toxin-antitoxin system Phd/YefM family antitoxin [Cyanobacteria bacterium UBA11149]|nr:type II toxin-antitoxin system Phd/YefM family antitoxin [Cyanobacteria bacterium UBA11366]HBR72259.1 type II toxin-antitoxin system Phd/YefM family antitoxin [Cyanobacteria bacterium UBA11159]HBS68431.1 type II toxin-antitoxin system Phd/YefM family antitoxin [Cyanobacteria bacterium UBA11153]HBW91909.1 type II toxin-antitoxin system Phd/YefM family antitoxin [Cyanobacteria bacterium UBA11149]HCA94480.1 type II toxin-antitoxin system Phd/YefM family antitoxin [Cyanobacteria bacterium UBA922
MLSLCDIHPLSEFQRGAKAFLVRLKETKTPIVLTVNGKAAAVVQDAESYQQLLDKIELLESIACIRKRIEEFERGEGMPLKKGFQPLQEK